MGTVFEAHALKMDRRVALKVLSRHVQLSEKGQDRFAREAWIGGRLNHPNLAKVYERGESEDLLFYSMELVDGGSLGDVVANLKRWGKDERWGLELGSRRYVVWAITQVIAAARGLDHAHHQGVVHRDVKPMNILLNRDPPGVKVVDFGIAIDTQATRMTTEGKLLGTVAYMAPEQILGQQQDVDARTDVYALGVTLFELLTLELPFRGESQQGYMHAVLTTEARRPSKLNERVGRDLEIVLKKALEKDRRGRYPSAGAFADDLENVLQFRPITARPPSTTTKLLRWVRRRPMHAALAATLAIGVPAFGVLLVRTLQHQRVLSEVEIAGLREEIQSLLYRRDYERALVALNELIRRSPDDVPGLRDRALTYKKLAAAVESDAARKSDLQDRALADAGRNIALLPDASWPYRVRAFLLRSFDRAGEAELDERTAALHATSARSDDDLYVDGWVALHSGRYEEAAQDFSTMLGEWPESLDARLSRAQTYEELGKLDQAKTDYEVALALKPRDFLTLHNLGRLQTLLGELEEGGAQIRRAIEIRPADAQAHVTLADNLYRQGQAKAAAGDTTGALVALDEAEASAERSLQLGPDELSALVNHGAILLARARLLGSADRTPVEAALARFDRAIAVHESGKRRDERAFASALLNECDALVELRELERALVACRKIAELRPDNPNNHYNLAGVYALLGRTEDALRELDRDFELGDRDHAYLSSDKWFVSLREDPRFVALLRRMETATPH
jgi:tetratricopeptide (TPR) repeat protein